MTLARRIVGMAAGAAGVAVAGTAVEVARRRRVIARRGAGDRAPLGSLRSAPRTVVASDGVPLHVEVDEYVSSGEAGRRRAGKSAAPPLTVVFVHGYALNLDCWHFQRSGYRGLVRTVYYDQRSHGRSGKSSLGHATIEQLGHDLKQVLDEVVPDGPLVLVGHSMGGMTIVALAELHPELFGDRVVGVGLISTTAGGLDPSRIVLPMLPLSIGGGLTHRAVRLLGSRASGDRRAAPDGRGLRDGRDGPVRVRRRRPRGVRRVRRQDARRDAVRGGGGVLPELREPRQVPRRRGRSARCRPRSSAAPTTG